MDFIIRSKDVACAGIHPEEVPPKEHVCEIAPPPENRSRARDTLSRNPGENCSWYPEVIDVPVKGQFKNGVYTVEETKTNVFTIAHGEEIPGEILVERNDVSCQGNSGGGMGNRNGNSLFAVLKTISCSSYANIKYIEGKTLPELGDDWVIIQHPKEGLYTALKENSNPLPDQETLLKYYEKYYKGLKTPINNLEELNVTALEDYKQTPKGSIFKLAFQKQKEVTQKSTGKSTSEVVFHTSEDRAVLKACEDESLRLQATSTQLPSTTPLLPMTPPSTTPLLPMTPPSTTPLLPNTTSSIPSSPIHISVVNAAPAENISFIPVLLILRILARLFR